MAITVHIYHRFLQSLTRLFSGSKREKQKRVGMQWKGRRIAKIVPNKKRSCTQAPGIFPEGANSI